jgi:hypothetical protein
MCYLTPSIFLSIGENWGKWRIFWVPGIFHGGRMEDNIKTGKIATERTAMGRTATGRMAIGMKVTNTPYEWNNAY